jgi:hypothetical protein
MRFSAFFVAAIATSLASVGFASENASFSVTTQVLKFGYSTSSSKPVEGDSTSSSGTYANFLGQDGEWDSPALMELGLKYGDYVAYLQPLGGADERAVWLGKGLSENLEVGVLFGGQSRVFNSGEKQGDGTTLKSTNFSTVGLFAIQSLQLWGQDFEWTVVPRLTMASSKYEESFNNSEELAYGAELELMYLREAAKNLTFGTGLSVDWSTNKVKRAGKVTATANESDFGIHVGRIQWSL